MAVVVLLVQTVPTVVTYTVAQAAIMVEAPAAPHMVITVQRVRVAQLELYGVRVVHSHQLIPETYNKG